MKRFLILAMVLLAVLAGGYTAAYGTSFYLPFLRRGEVITAFRAEENGFLASSDPEASALRGVSLSSFIPGHYFSDYAADKDDYLRWFGEIAEMGANTVEVPLLMDDDCYNALYEYNTTHDEPLWLIQGLRIGDSVLRIAETAFESGMRDSLIAQGKLAVDVIHGRRNVAATETNGGGRYRRDVSKWVVGYAVTTDLGADNIAYTDHSFLYTGEYEGAYFRTTEDAGTFEAMLAEVMDRITAYEAGKYRAIRPVGVTLNPLCDFLNYSDLYARQLGKYAAVDTEHIRPTEANRAGCFTLYELTDICADFADCLTAEDEARLAGLLGEIDRTQRYGGYLELLAQYHTVPVVGVVSASSARAATEIGNAPMTEAEQGHFLTSTLSLLSADGWAGGIVSEWQDVWTRRSWNTAYATIVDNTNLWHDLNTAAQNLGLMSFEPGAEAVCVIDGDPSEWDDDTPVLETDTLRLYVRYDALGVYLLIEGELYEDGRPVPLALPIDVSGEVGSSVCAEPNLAFARGADFVLLIDGGARLLVNERYDAHRENFLYATEGIDPFIDEIPADTSRFVPVTLALDNDLLIEDASPESKAAQRLGQFEAGRLRAGIGSHDAPAYDSLADFCYGENVLEIRIPWLLINVGDPPNMQVHRDYYAVYGVEFTPVRRLWFGLGTLGAAEVIPMEAVSVRPWSKIEYRERLKQSYYIVQNYWRGGERDEIGG